MDFLVFLIPIIVFLIIAWAIYNTLIIKRNKVFEAMSGVDIQLKKRYDLLPNLIKVASEYLKYEKEVLEKITLLRKEGLKTKDIDKKLIVDEKISNLIARFENYPELKSNTAMLNLMQTNSEIEEHISAARRFYNSAVLDFNNAVNIFPNSLFAKIFNIQTIEFFKAKENEKRVVNFKEHLN